MDRGTDTRRRMNDDRRHRFGASGRTLALLCECDDPGCTRTVLLSLEEYDARRPGGAIVHPEHVIIPEATAPSRPSPTAAHSTANTARPAVPRRRTRTC